MRLLRGTGKGTLLNDISILVDASVATYLILSKTGSLSESCSLTEYCLNISGMITLACGKVWRASQVICNNSILPGRANLSRGLLKGRVKLSQWMGTKI